MTLPLFQEIVDRYRPEGAVPRYFAQVLPGFGVTEAAKHEVARIFMASAEYAGVLAADGVFLDENSDSVKPAAQPPVQEDTQGEREVVPFSPEASQASPPSSESDLQVFRFFLTDRKPAELKLPAGLNEADIAMLKKHIEFLEFQVQISRPAAPLPFRRPGKTGESA